MFTKLDAVPKNRMNKPAGLHLKSCAKIPTQLLFLVFLLFANQANAKSTDGGNCTTDSLKIESNDKKWTVINNNFGAPNNVTAKIITYQYNSLPGFDAFWISYTTNWIQYSTYSVPADDSFMTLRYSFKHCGADFVRLNFLVRRDNYCTVTLDGNISLLQDVPATNNATYTGTQIDTTVFLDTCTHNIDFKVYNRADFNGGNGYGLLVGGWLSSKSGKLFTNAEGCEGYTCCKPAIPSGIAQNTAKEEVHVYPNPAHDFISVVVPQSAAARHYVLRNYLGQAVAEGLLSVNSTQTGIRISHLSNGLYMLNIEGTKSPVKILKQ